MAIVLSDVQGLVERAIYKAIRLVVEELGYIPVVTNYTNDEAGQLAYNAAVKAIAASNKRFAIEVFGHSNNQSKGNLAVPRFVLKPRRIIEGGVGYDMGKTLKPNEDEDGSYTSYVVQGSSSNIHIELSLVTNTAEQHRKLHSILHYVMGNRGYKITSTNQTFFYRYIGYDDNEELERGLSTNTYTYEVVDVDMAREQIIDEAVAKIVEIDIELYTGTYFPTDTHDIGDYELTDTLEVDAP